MDTAMQTQAVAAAYDRWAPIYDLVFGAVFRRGRSIAIDAANRVGGRVLEVGVGTGISLPHYSTRCTLYGIDISDGILAKARERATGPSDFRGIGRRGHDLPVQFLRKRRSSKRPSGGSARRSTNSIEPLAAAQSA